MKIFQCANNACSGGAPMVFPQSALSVQDILNMQEANLLGTLPSGLLPATVPAMDVLCLLPILARTLPASFH